MDKTKATIALFDKYARKYQAKYMDLEGYHDSLDLFSRNIKGKNAGVLDIACGPGNLTRYILNKRPDFRILGIDLSPKMIELARINNPEAEFQLMDCRHIQKIEKKYDAVVSGFCLPYLSKEEVLKFITDVSALLVSGGMFYLSTIEDDYERSGYEGSESGLEGPMYIYYHQSDYLLKALRDDGFKIIDLKRKSVPDKKPTTKKDLVILAEKVKGVQ
jgi:predicted TPR repeat methyltransferase